MSSFVHALGETRTPTPRWAHEPESCLSANSSTRAVLRIGGINFYFNLIRKDLKPLKHPPSRGTILSIITMVKSPKRNKVEKNSEPSLESIIEQLSDENLPVIHRLVLCKFLTENKTMWERLSNSPQLKASFLAKMEELKRESRLKGLTGF